MEYDETGTEAAVRELGEETGLSVRESALSLFTTNHVTHPDGWTVLVLVYTVSRDQTDGDPVARSDAAAARFWDLDELADEGEQLEPSYHEIVAGAIEREQTATDETRVHH
jgi:ADP-ribose pyrophosphatase YjhB (NUDIX family)